MPIKEYNPTSPGRRAMTVVDFSDLSKKEPEKNLLERISRKGGRNNHGHTTSRFRGGGHRKLYRKIDFKRDMDNVPAKVVAIEYDPNRTARVALLHYANGAKSYILAPIDLRIGMTVQSGDKVEPTTGNTMPLENIPIGIAVHNVELTLGKGGQIGRSAGSVIQYTAREGDYAILALPSGELRKVHAKCRATIGQLGNLDHQNVSAGKAGRTRWKGRRSHNRGTAQNPIAHPMGGGEGRTGGGRHPCSPTGVLSKGGKTRSKKRPSGRFIIRRRKK